MQYEIEIGGRVRQISVNRAGDRFTVSVDSHALDVDVASVDAQTLLLLVSEAVPSLAPDASTGTPLAFGLNRTFEVVVTRDPASAELTVSVGTTPVAVTLNDRRRWRRRDDGAHSGKGPQRIVAPMPGKIVRVLVKSGDAVSARQPLVVVEAMKMENELRAGRDGTIGEIFVREGASVDAGTPLVVIE